MEFKLGAVFLYGFCASSSKYEYLVSVVALGEDELIC
jgi:hypothetical protein